ncbi:type II secretion system protein GspM [Pseudemcibacter aquimaris]|uniref:type II secretion system protein GspM n=1 Tax=Pseudemcibacter aquimaris TaxID=2857064 RepID=UPI002012D565|nr:type II secretion system protein GspM [Pseudemcibacter aquimaris]MCC3861754.1 type II secretion system protein M [Pseudemcibacter aquimaris]WDU58523.1 type II secretion system protein M [Pseudemcibacter aquimaris]
MMNFWNGLQRREQNALMIMVVAIIIFLIYVLLVMPLISGKENALRALDDEKARYERIMQLAVTAGPSQNVSADIKAVLPIREAATDASRNAGVSISRIQPGRDNTVTFWVDRAGTSEMMNWLLMLQNEYGHVPVKVTIQKNTGEETLRGQFEFESVDS